MGTGLYARRAALGRTRTTRVRIQAERKAAALCFKLGHRGTGWGRRRGGHKVGCSSRIAARVCCVCGCSSLQLRINSSITYAARTAGGHLRVAGFLGEASEACRRVCAGAAPTSPFVVVAPAPWQRLRTGLTAPPSPTVAFLASAAMVIISADPRPSAGRGGGGQAESDC